MRSTCGPADVRRLTVVAASVSLAVVFLAGCGGGGDEPSAPAQERGQPITAAPTLEQLQADLTAAGKPLPEFLSGGMIVPDAVGEQAMTPASYMTPLRLGRWRYNQRCRPGRVQWYECNLRRAWALTDVVVADEGGDPDLYVFSPLRPLNGWNSLKLVGYSIGTRDEQVGSFYAGRFGGRGRFIVAVHAYGRRTARYDLLVW